MRKLFLFIFSFYLSFFQFVVGQGGLPIPPTNEKTKHFSFPVFDRQPNPPDHIQNGINELKKKNISEWTQQDSLYYAFELTFIKKYEYALSFFYNLNTDTIKNVEALHIYQHCLKKTQRYQTLINSIENQKNHHPDLSDLLLVRRRIAEVRLYKRDLEWVIADRTIFPKLKDSSFQQFKRFSPAVLNKIKPIARNHEKALRIETRYSDETDIILSKGYEEFGDFLHKNFYISNAYRAYLISRHFDKKNNRVSKKIKAMKEELDDKNLLLPSFVSIFPRIDEDKYDFSEVSGLDSLNIALKDDKEYLTLEDIIRQEEEEIKDFIPWLDIELVSIIIIVVLLFVVVLFIRADRKR